VFLNEEDSDPVDLGPGISDVLDEMVNYIGDLSANVSFEQEHFFKGDTIPFELKIQVDQSPARLNTLKIEVLDLNLTRHANQSIELDKLFNPGTYTIDLNLRPGFENDGFVALTNKNYTLTGYELNYTQIQKSNLISGSLNHSLVGHQADVFDQSLHLNWDIISEINASITINQNNMTVISSEENATISIQTTIETTAYTRILYNVTGLTNSTIKLNDTMIILDSESNYYPIGQYNGKQNFTILFNITKNEDINFSISMPTQKISILTVVANNNWDTLSEDGYIFRDPDYYLDQINIHFSSVFNMTFISVANVAFDHNPLISNLGSMRVNAELSVGNALKLPDERWTTKVGTQIQNAGGDILLILSNNTMDNLGVVFRDTTTGSDQNLNLAIAARGSKNTGSDGLKLRLPQGWADNLIQHEISHIFRAPDRWTNTDDPSVMTKSDAVNIFADIVLDEFWLDRTDWLEPDIQTMVDRIELFLVEY
ncbi:MAG: hypothetical protein ACW99Q_19185, partial [Candidatus Kariarchaeaceae archaeon]